MAEIVKRTKFFEAFKSYFKVFRVCFFFPYSCSCKHYFRIIYTLRLVYSLYIISYLAHRINRIYLDTSKKNDTVNGIIRLTLKFSDILAFFTYVIYSDWTKDVQVQIVQKFDQIDTMMTKRLQIEMNYAAQKESINKGTAVCIIFILVSLPLNLVQVFLKKETLFHVVLQNIHMNFVFGKCVQYIFYINLMKIRLTMMQQRLERLLGIQEPVTTVYGKEMSKNKKNCFIFEEIETIKLIYGTLWRINNALNSCFGISLLVIVMNYFIHIVCE